jgi:ribosomal protein S18 acetylase RimI-like enzyme
MKRLYVREQGRGIGLGSKLVSSALYAGAQVGYRAMRLDTLAHMSAAQALYRHQGFRVITPYYQSPVPGTIFMECDLGDRR